MPGSLGSAMFTQTSPHRDADLQMKGTSYQSPGSNTAATSQSALLCLMMGQQALNLLPLVSSPHTHNLLAVCLTLQRGQWHPLNPWPKLCKAREAWNLETTLAPRHTLRQHHVLEKHYLQLFLSPRAHPSLPAKKALCRNYWFGSAHMKSR